CRATGPLCQSLLAAAWVEYPCSLTYHRCGLADRLVQRRAAALHGPDYPSVDGPGRQQYTKAHPGAVGNAFAHERPLSGCDAGTDNIEAVWPQPGAAGAHR